MAAGSAPSPVAYHKMVCKAHTPAKALFVCTDDTCGRRVVVGKTQPGLTVIDRGDFSARHAGFLGDAAFEGVALA